jgi:hypothetical protein
MPGTRRFYTFARCAFSAIFARAQRRARVEVGAEAA